MILGEASPLAVSNLHLEFQVYLLCVTSHFYTAQENEYHFKKLEAPYFIHIERRVIKKFSF